MRQAMDSARSGSRIPHAVDTYSLSNKQTEDFKRSLAENVGATASANTSDDPIFTLIIRLLRESIHPSAKDLLNYYYVSCETSPESIEYFYAQAKTGDAVARVQLGKLFREGKLAHCPDELQVIAEAFACQHELAIVKLSTSPSLHESPPTDESEFDRRFKEATAKMDPFTQEQLQSALNGEIDSTTSEEDDSPHRSQHRPIARVTDSATHDSSTVEQSPEKNNVKPATKSKNKRSKHNTKAKRAKELVNG